MHIYYGFRETDGVMTNVVGGVCLSRTPGSSQGLPCPRTTPAHKLRPAARVQASRFRGTPHCAFRRLGGEVQRS